MRATGVVILLAAGVMLGPAPGTFAQVTDSGPTLPDPFERAPMAVAERRLIVTVPDLMRRDRLEVLPRTEVVWADPHFLRVWFPPSGNGPLVERIEGGFRAVFDRPGTYRGLFTLAGWRQGEIYPIRVIVKGGTP